MSTRTIDTSPTAPRQRLLDTAARVFYAEGIHTVGVDRLVTEASVTRATFYRHFPAKEDLVVAYLQGQDQDIRRRFAAGAAAATDPLQLLNLLVVDLSAQICGPGFRGCPFINAAAEYPDPESAVHRAVITHRTWFHAAVQQLATALGAPDPEQAAVIVGLLRDGAMVGGYLSDPDRTQAGLAAAIGALFSVTS